MRIVLPDMSMLTHHASAARGPWIAPLLVVVLIASISQTGSKREYEIKAGLIYSFLKFVEWPQDVDHGETLTIGIVGKDPYETVLLEVLNGKTVDHRKVVVRPRLNIRQATRCDVVFIPRSAGRAVIHLTDELRRFPILIIGELDGFLDRGGMINFYSKDGEIRFEINKRVADQARLKISAKLLKLAGRVLR